MSRKQTPPRRSATRKKSDSAATGAVIDIGWAASAHDEPDLEVVFDADLRPELAGSIARPLMREVYASRTALAAELVVSELMGMSRLACPPATSWDEKSEVVDALMSDVTAVAAADGSPPALALLRVIAVLAAPGVSGEAEKAAHGLADAGVADRPWARYLGRPKFVRAWQCRDIFGSQESVAAMFDYGSREHVASVLIDHPLGGGVKDCWIAQGKRARSLRALTAERMSDNPMSFFEDLNMGKAHDVLSAALANDPCPEQVDQVRDVFAYLPLVAARVVLLGAGTDPPS